MMNIIQLQDNLKNLSDQQLTHAVQMPSQDTPPFLVVSELNRRKKMRDSFQAQQADQNKTTVAQDVVAAAGVPQGPASQMAQSLAPKTDMTNNTGIMSIPQGGEPQRMAGGGRVTKMAEGMTVPGYSNEAVQAWMQSNGLTAADVAGLSPEDIANALQLYSLPNMGQANTDWAPQGISTVEVPPAEPTLPPEGSFTPLDILADYGITIGLDNTTPGGRAIPGPGRSPVPAENVAIDAQRAADTKGPPKTNMTYGIPEALGRIAPVAGATPDASKPPTTSGGGSGGGGGGAAKPSDYEQALMDALKNADKKAKQDKWMSLAQMGLSMMSSQSPTLLGAVGEAGTAAIPSFQKARDTADDTKLGLKKGLYDIAQQRQARNDAMAAAAARANVPGKPKPIDASALTALDSQIKDAAARLDSLPEGDAKLQAANELDQLKREARYIRNAYLQQRGISGGISSLPLDTEDPADSANLSD